MDEDPPLDLRRSWKTGEQQTAVGAAGLMALGGVDPEMAPYVAAIAIAVVLGRALVKAATALAARPIEPKAPDAQS
ncbi:hypothetical protein [Engelhardtia mirabilis]|uniref:Uncharacterized protein n=1 Tax=Engelhardtia mirabilis TaxID=2528011 RepID=A0A518BL37_9BACT|nr:hypothetical protein Pla133_27700 [Planctomycetes bacterium Pla133]QDV02008.1 hypothetical protein Pla86_27690 [Planctomycetes bacterium Pla86]